MNAMSSTSTSCSTPAVAGVAPTSTPKDLSARILKKRESDRRCQRIKRERTKTKIAALEERVRNFGDQDSTGQVQLLMKQLQKIERERDELAKKVKTIESVIRDSDEDEQSTSKPVSIPETTVSAYASPITARSFEHSAVDLKDQSYQSEQHPDTFNTGTQEELEKTIQYSQLFSDATVSAVDDVTSAGNFGIREVYTTGTDNPSEAVNYHSRLHSGQSCECCSTPATSPQGPQFNTWRFTNQVLSSRFKWPAFYQLLQDTHRDDTPVRAVVEGWDSIESRGPMHPSWHILKKIDQVLFQKCGAKERLAVMSAVHLLLMSHVTPDLLPELPNFYRKRPSQSMADSYAIHFFPWPGMRERFVFNQHRYCTNDFWNTFINSLRIKWPYEFRDCYTKNVETGLYSMSPLFHDRVNDINAWAMEAEVFVKWPELRADIPVYSSIPRSITNMSRRPPPLVKSSSQSRSRYSQGHGVKNLPLQPPTGQSVQQYPQPQDLIPASYYSHNTYDVDGKTGLAVPGTEILVPEVSGNLSFYTSGNSVVPIGPGFL